MRAGAAGSSSLGPCKCKCKCRCSRAAPPSCPPARSCSYSCSRDRTGTLRCCMCPGIVHAELIALEHCHCQAAHLLRAALPRSPPIRLPYTIRSSPTPLFSSSFLILFHTRPTPFAPSHPVPRDSTHPSPSAGTRPLASLLSTLPFCHYYGYSFASLRSSLRSSTRRHGQTSWQWALVPNDDAETTAILPLITPVLSDFAVLRLFVVPHSSQPSTFRSKG